MTRRRKFAGATAVVAVLLSHRAAADPGSLRLLSGAQCHTDGGTDLRLEPGRYYSEATFATLDAEVRRLQNAETRLAAENASLRKSATAQPSGPVWTVVVAAGTALAAGIGIGLWTSDR